MNHPQVNQWLAGERTPDVKAHLESCSECAARLAELEAPLAAFRDSVHQWSARRMVPAISVAPRGPFAGWLRIAVAAAALVVIAAVGIHRYDQRAAQAAAQEDEVLLEQVATDVARSVPVTLEPLARLMSNSTTEGSAQ
jgi:hypothetical protein